MLGTSHNSCFDVCFIMMAYRGILSWIWKLNISMILCISQSIHMITSTAVCKHLSRPVQVLISHCHLLLLSTHLKSYLSTAWNQQLIDSCWICYIAISNLQHPYIYQCLCHVTQRNISIHFVLPATASHTATLETKLTVYTDCLLVLTWNYRKIPSMAADIQPIN